MIAKNDVFETKITDLSDDGAGIGKTDGYIWFIKDAVIGDRVRASATKIGKSYGYARLVSVLEPSGLPVPHSEAVRRMSAPADGVQGTASF